MKGFAKRVSAVAGPTPRMTLPALKLQVFPLTVVNVMLELAEAMDALPKFVQVFGAVER